MGESAAPRRIAVLHLNQVGDLVFSLPALAALRAGFPGARLVSVLRQNLAPLLEATGLADEVVSHRGSRDFFRTADRLRALRVDLAVCLSESPRNRLLAYLSGAPRRVGLGDGPLASLLTERVQKIGLPSTANNLRVVGALGCPRPTESYQGLLKVEAQYRERAQSLLAEAAMKEGPGGEVTGRRVVLAPGASRGRESKEWPSERFVRVASHVAGLPDTHAVIVGVNRMPPVQAGEMRGWIDLSGRTDLLDLVGLLAGAELFVGNDSGVLHLAAALGVPCVALFGPTDPDETGPAGTGHTVLRAEPPHQMASISHQAVIEAVDRALAASSPTE